MGDPGNMPVSEKASTQLDSFMPSEHLPHLRTLTAFPTLKGVYDDEDSLRAARREVASIANAISEFEPVWLYAGESHAPEARKLVNEKVEVREADVDNLWIRDLGPTFLHGVDSRTDAAVDFNFNHWGGKSFPSEADQTFVRRIVDADFPGVKRHQANIVSEGGALEIDGEGTLLVTDSSVVNDNRNPGVSQEAIEAELKRVLGVTKVIWLKGVKGLESTDWHVDAFARFVEPAHVFLSQPPPNAHPDILHIYNDALEKLSRETDAKGRRIRVTSILEPDQELLSGGSVDGMVTSYVNYLLVNGGVIMAKFGQETDLQALEQMRSVFPDRQIRQVFINELPRQGGGIHCATQQVPV